MLLHLLILLVGWSFGIANGKVCVDPRTMRSYRPGDSWKEEDCVEYRCEAPGVVTVHRCHTARNPFCALSPSVPSQPFPLCCPQVLCPINFILGDSLGESRFETNHASSPTVGFSTSQRRPQLSGVLPPLPPAHWVGGMEAPSTRAPVGPRGFDSNLNHLEVKEQPEAGEEKAMWADGNQETESHAGGDTAADAQFSTEGAFQNAPESGLNEDPAPPIFELPGESKPTSQGSPIMMVPKTPGT